MWTLYDYADSGNGYKVRLALHQLSIPYRLAPIDILRGESRSAEFLAKNPNGRIPVLELDGGTCLPESNAILYFVADGSALLPNEALARAQVLSWMFFEQYSHEPYVATTRFLLRHLPADHPRRAEVPDRQRRGREALSVMECALAGRSFLVAERYTIADIALYAYTHRAHEAEIDLAPYPAVRAWLRRIEEQPRWTPMSLS